MQQTLDAFLLNNYQSNFNMEEIDSFSNNEVFIQTKNGPSSLEKGSRSAEAGESITILLTNVAQGNFVVAYVSPLDSRLVGPYVGLKLEEAFEVVLALTKADGLILQSSQEAALVVEKKDFKIRHQIR